MRTIFLSLMCLALGAVGTTGTAYAEEPETRQNTIVYIDGAKYYVHTVAAGETLYSISRLYGVDVADILEYNPAAADGLRRDSTIKIPVSGNDPVNVSTKKKRKDYEYHTVAAGETLYSISRSYGISIDTVLEDNPDVDPAQLTIGTRLYIRKSAVGSAHVVQVGEEWEAYRDNLNAVAPEGYFYYIVQPKETLYSLSRRFGITEETILSLNELPDGLKAGGILMLPLSGEAIQLQKQSQPRQPQQKPQQPNVSEQPAETPDATPDEETEYFPGSDFGKVYDTGEEDEQIDDFGFIRRYDRFESVDPRRPLRIALMLPMSRRGSANAHYMDFYRGFLLGAETVKASGHAVELTLFDTEQSSAKVESIIDDDFGGFKPDLIVGPVYENTIAPVVGYAERMNIPVVSPLASLSSVESRVVFQMSPDSSHKYDKVADLFDGSREVTLIYGETVDRDFEREVLSLLNGKRYATHKYVYEHQSVIERRAKSANGSAGPGDFTGLLRGSKNSVFVVLSNTETEVDRILAALASADIALRTRERTAAKFVVFGSSKWHRYNNLDSSIFFRDGLVSLSSYVARRDNDKVRSFDDRYITDYESMPSPYSYRGYDAAVIFGMAMFGDIERGMEGRRYMPLQTSYTFEKASEGAKSVNIEWMRIDCRDDFTTKVE